MCFSSYKNCELKVKLWWVEARKRIKKAFFVTFVWSEGNFFNIFFLSKCIVHWINFQNIYTFTYQETLLYTLLLLDFKFVKSLQCILKGEGGTEKFVKCWQWEASILLVYLIYLKYKNYFLPIIIIIL